MAYLALAARPCKPHAMQPSIQARRLFSQTPMTVGRPIKVGVLGCTGVVGQRFVQLLEGHPQMSVYRLGASERSAGKLYQDAASWKLGSDIPRRIAEMEVKMASVEHFTDCDLVFSALDTAPAKEIEPAFAQAGIPVFSNASAFRMHPRVPIVIPDVNPDHILAVKDQTHTMGFSEGGFIVTNANCSTTSLTVALKPLQDAFGLKKLFVTTLQAVSGAGYPGVPSLDVMDNLVPHIPGEEPKMETETLKIFGGYDGNFNYLEDTTISVMCTRVPVSDGHTECASMEFHKANVTPEMALEALRSAESPARVHGLPSLPDETLAVFDAPNRPQPRLDRDLGGGYTTSIGGVRSCNLFDVKLNLLGHNTVLGAAGGSILNAELALAKGLVGARSFSTSAAAGTRTLLGRSIPGRPFSSSRRSYSSYNTFSTPTTARSPAPSAPQPSRFVFKMGGSSLGNPEAIHRACQINYETVMRGNELCVVVSALYGVTNMLEEACHLANDGKLEELSKLRAMLVEHHVATVRSLLSHGPDTARLINKLVQRVEHIMQKYFDVYTSKIAEHGLKAGSNWMEAVSSLGERLSVPIVCSVLASQGVQVYELYTDNLVVKSENSTQNGGVNTKVTMQRLQGKLAPLLRQGIVPVISGFIATSEDGHLTTLGRGGSDLTATLVASAVRADSVHLWKVEPTKDADGFMTAWADLKEQYKWMGIRSADPSAVQDNLLVANLSYEEATELTKFGKKVLHTATMSPVEVAEIPIFVRNTAVPSQVGSCIGLLDKEKGQSSEICARAVTSISLNKYKTLHAKTLDQNAAVYEALEAHAQELNVEPSTLHIVSLIGKGIGRAQDVVQPACLDLLTASNFTPAPLPLHLAQMIGSDNSISFVVPENQADQVSLVLHDAHVAKQSEAVEEDAEVDVLLWGLGKPTTSPLGNAKSKNCRHFSEGGSAFERESYMTYFDKERTTNKDANELYGL